MKLKNELVTIELKNKTLVEGTIVGVDIKMNIHLKFVKLTPRGKNPVKHENYSVRGSSIRHVVLPDELPIDVLLIQDKHRIKKKESKRMKKIKKKKR